MYKKLLFPFLILSLSLMIITGCDEDNGTEPTPVNEFDLVAAVGDVYFTNYTNAAGASANISAADLNDLLTDADTSNDPYVIDFRSATLYNEKHIKGAVNMTYEDVVAKLNDGTIPKDKTVVNVCYSGQGASRVTAMMNMLGYQARNLLFAYCSIDTSLSSATGWVDAIAEDEYTDLETTANTTTTTHDFPTINTGKTTAEEIIKERFSLALTGWSVSATDVWDNPSNYFIINYWPESEYLNPGHIPGAYQFTPKSSLKTTEMLNLLPTDKTIVVYCYTGQTSSQVVTYLRILGYDAKSLSYGFSGFAYNAPGYTGGRYTAPEPGIYDDMLE